MKKPGSVFAVLLLAAVLLFMPCPGAYAATDGYYNVSQTTSTWDGTDASRFEPATPDYNYAYGDEASVTYTLPWNLTFYGQTYTGITADVNGNIWLNASGSVYSFNLSATVNLPRPVLIRF